MGKIIRHATLENAPFWFFVFLSAGIGIAGFIVAPPGELHSSILKFISWMFAFDALWVFYKAFTLGLDARFQKGDVSVTLGSIEKSEKRPKIEQDTEESEESEE